MEQGLGCIDIAHADNHVAVHDQILDRNLSVTRQAVEIVRVESLRQGLRAERGQQGAAGAVNVTASHNPAEWKALKLASGEGMFLDGDASLRFREHLKTQDLPRAAWERRMEARRVSCSRTQTVAMGSFV